jgi:hypothetical protein
MEKSKIGFSIFICNNPQQSPSLNAGIRQSLQLY